MTTREPVPEPPGARSTTPHLTAARMAQWLIHRAARCAPADLAERLEEEWLADLACCASRGARLRFALGCCWAARVIGSEYSAASLAVATPAASGKLVIAGLGSDSDFFPRNSLTVIAVVAFHIAVFYALLVGMGVTVNLIPTSFQTRIIPGARPVEPLPALPHPTITDLRFRVPPPAAPITSTVEDPVEAIPQAPNDMPVSPPTTSVTHEVSRVAGGPGAGFPATEDYYPSAARRAEEQGIATLRVCVDPSGRLTAVPVILQGSGYARLDEGALQLARAGSGHYRASTEDGHAVNSCYAFRVRFELRR